MFRARTLQLRDSDGHLAEEIAREEEKAFSLMREGLTSTVDHKQHPRLSVYPDQIVWGRSPVRIDLAGGWTDTPPYSLMEGGNVVNIAIELNGQPRYKSMSNPVMSIKSFFVPSTWVQWKLSPLSMNYIHSIK